MRTQIEVGTAAVLELVAPDGPPDAPAPSFELRGPEDEELLAADAAKLDALAIEGEAVEGSPELAFDGPESLPTPGRRLWLSTPGGGYGYEVEVADVDETDGYVTLTEGSRINGAIKLAGLTLSYALTADQVGAVVRRRCRALWRYTRGGAPRMVATVVDIVRQPWNLSLTAAKVDRIAAPFGLELGAWRGVLRQAEDDVFAHLAASGLEPDRVLERELLESAAAWRALALRHVHVADIYDRAQSEYVAALARFDASSAWYSDRDRVAGGSTPTRAPAQQRFRIGDR